MSSKMKNENFKKFKKLVKSLTFYGRHSFDSLVPAFLSKKSKKLDLGQKISNLFLISCSVNFNAAKCLSVKL